MISCLYIIVLLFALIEAQDSQGIGSKVRLDLFSFKSTYSLNLEELREVTYARISSISLAVRLQIVFFLFQKSQNFVLSISALFTSIKIYQFLQFLSLHSLKHIFKDFEMLQVQS